jgi:methylmalonyl-CoA epimerase
MRLEHIGVAVNASDAAARTFRALLAATPYKTETVPDQGVRTQFLDAGSAKLELLEALAEESPVRSFLEQRGEGVHHLAFEVEDLEATMKRLRAADLPLLNDVPQPGADDKRICFVHPKATHGVLVEFCDTPPVADWPPHTVAHRDGSLAVYERGRRSRETILCLHGAAGCVRHDLAPLMRRLEPRAHVVGVDLSGHGASSMPPDGPLTLDRFVDDARAALDAAETESAHVFGFSLGASVALRLAQRTPERVRRLALLSPHLDWTEAQSEALQSRLDLDALRANAPDRAASLTARHEAPARLLSRLRAFVAALPRATEGAFDALAQITAPTLVAALDDDPLFPLDATRAVQHSLPDARWAVLPGSTHALSAVPFDVLAPLLRRHFDLS